ncbi:MAG: type II toxin-antitoxin system VapC family toxin [Nitrospiria bacterium]
MELIYLDTSFLFAFYNRTDRYHRKAHQFFQEIISQQQVGWAYTDYIFDELLTLILIRNKDKTKAIFTGKSLLNSQTIQLFYLKPETINRSWNLFAKYRDKQWSFTDCTSIVFMKENNISRITTFDSHFKEAGLIPIPLLN